MHSCFATATGPDDMIKVVREMQDVFFRHPETRRRVSQFLAKT
jgi:hypothetical protein